MSDARARRRKAALALVAVLAVGVGALALWMRARTGDAIPSGGHGGGGGGAMAPVVLPEGEAGALASNPRTPAPPGMGAPTRPVEAPAEPRPLAGLPAWKHVRFALVDAATGLPLDGSAVTRPPSIEFGRRSEEPGSSAQAWLRIDAAPGFVAVERRQFHFAPELATAGVSVVYPLHRAIDLEVTVLDAAGNAVLEANLSVATARAGVRLHLEESTGPGRYLLRALPYEPRGPVFVGVTRPGSEQAEPTSPEEGWVPSVTYGSSFTVRMPEDHAPQFEATLRMNPDPPHDGDVGRAPEGPAPRVVPPRLKWGSVRVRVRRRDGSPAAGARVWWGGAREQACDADGVAILQAVAVGRQPISLADPRLVPITAPVEVRVDETTDVDLVEPDPAMLDVTVVDGDGKAIPAARVEVRTPSGMPALDIVDGVLRLDPYTDALGRRTFTRVEPGLVSVTASARGWSLVTEVTLRPGMRSSVTATFK